MNFKKTANAAPSASPAKGQPTESQKATGTRNLKNGAYASALAVVMLAAVILVNLVAGAVPTKYTQYDISTSGLFTLSDTTKTMLKALDKDVTAYYLAETGSEDANITRILDRYAGESSHFTWQQRDPAMYPTFAQQYDAQNATSGSVILVCGDQSSIVDYNDMYQADYSNYSSTGSYSTSFNAESALTGGIAKVTSSTAYVLYQLSGHGETALESTFTDTLSNAKVTVQSLSLVSTGAVPSDASVLLINNPQTDFSADDIAAVKTYLDNGGRLLVTTGMEISTPNLDGLLAEYGMSRQPGLLIENESSHYAYRYPQTYLLPDVSRNDVTGGMTDGMYVFAPVAQGILTDDANADLTVSPLLTTTASSYAMQNYATAETAQQSDTDPTGPFNVAVAVENTATNARVAWINCANIFVSNIDQAVSGGNSQLLGSIVNWMNGEENAVVIDAKSLSAASLVVPTTAVMGFGLLFVLALPVVCLVVGIVIFVLRRRK